MHDVAVVITVADLPGWVWAWTRRAQAVRDITPAWLAGARALRRRASYEERSATQHVDERPRGLPDIGLTTLTEVATRAGQIARMTDLPSLVDADTGFGEPMNVARSIQELENAGLAGCHIEDQFNPKRCGHLDGKNVVDLDTAIKRIRAAADARRDPNFLIMARTDIRAVEGLEAAQERAKALVEAGADAIFPEAMATLEEFKAIRDAVDVPVLANMTEFGKSALFTVDELQSVGVNMVIYPVTLLRIAMGAAESTLETIKRLGTQEVRVGAMLTRSRLYDLVDYEAYNQFDTGVFNFQVPGTH